MFLIFQIRESAALSHGALEPTIQTQQAALQDNARRTMDNVLHMVLPNANIEERTRFTDSFNVWLKGRGLNAGTLDPVHQLGHMYFFLDQIREQMMRAPSADLANASRNRTLSENPSLFAASLISNHFSDSKLAATPVLEVYRAQLMSGAAMSQTNLSRSLFRPPAQAELIPSMEETTRTIPVRLTFTDEQDSTARTRMGDILTFVLPLEASPDDRSRFMDSFSTWLSNRTHLSAEQVERLTPVQQLGHMYFFLDEVRNQLDNARSADLADPSHATTPSPALFAASLISNAFERLHEQRTPALVVFEGQLMAGATMQDLHIPRRLFTQ